MIMENGREYLVDVVVEIPRGSRNKYEYDPVKKMIRLDRMLFSSIHYPCDYGFVPDTLAPDGDPLDALVLLSQPTFPGCLIQIRPIGVLKCYDEKGVDHKIVCVPPNDPNWKDVYSIEGVRKHLRKEIEHFFTVYKQLENKKAGVEGWDEAEVAIELIRSSQLNYVEK
jgi:inorganic pyrophosphatase